MHRSLHLRRRRAALLLATALLLAACSTSADRGIEGVPLPPGSVVLQEETESDEFLQLASWRVRDATVDDVIAFFERELPAGTDFGEWEWCRSNPADSLGGWSHVYSKDATELLVVMAYEREDTSSLRSVPVVAMARINDTCF